MACTVRTPGVPIGGAAPRVGCHLEIVEGAPIQCGARRRVTAGVQGPPIRVREHGSARSPVAADRFSRVLLEPVRVCDREILTREPHQLGVARRVSARAIAEEAETVKAQLLRLPDVPLHVGVRAIVLRIPVVQRPAHFEATGVTEGNQSSHIGVGARVELVVARCIMHCGCVLPSVLPALVQLNQRESGVGEREGTAAAVARRGPVLGSDGFDGCRPGVTGAAALSSSATVEVAATAGRVARAARVVAGEPGMHAAAIVAPEHGRRGCLAIPAGRKSRLAALEPAD